MCLEPGSEKFCGGTRLSGCGWVLHIASTMPQTTAPTIPQMFSLAFSGANVEHCSGLEWSCLGLRHATVHAGVLFFEVGEEETSAGYLEMSRGF